MKLADNRKADTASILAQALALPVIEGERIYSGVFGGTSATLTQSQYRYYTETVRREVGRKYRASKKVAA